MKRIVFLWVGTVAASIVISAVAGPRRWKFFWLIPVRPSPALLWKIFQNVFQTDPVIGVRIALFTAMTLITIGWVAWHTDPISLDCDLLRRVGEMDSDEQYSCVRSRCCRLPRGAGGRLESPTMPLGVSA